VIGVRGLKVFLFDIDGTLMLSGGAGKRSMERAFADLFGVPHAFNGFDFQGKVDPAIFREAIRLHNLRPADEDAAIRQLIDTYERYVADEMPRTTTAVLMPGVRELLERLAGRPDVSLGLLTGNLLGGARAKLSHFDLWRFFPYGAFGSDHEDRRALVPIALARASVHLRLVIEPGRHVYVIGDTDRDIACAKANNCTAVGVATLGFTAEQLRSLGADIVFQDLSDTARVLRELGVDHE